MHNGETPKSASVGGSDGDINRQQGQQVATQTYTVDDGPAYGSMLRESNVAFLGIGAQFDGHLRRPETPLESLNKTHTSAYSTTDFNTTPQNTTDESVGPEYVLGGRIDDVTSTAPILLPGLSINI